MTTQQHRHQQEKEPFNPPSPIPSPIPPLTKYPGKERLALAYSRPCKYCGVQIIIKNEQISDDRWNNKSRYRYVPRDSKILEIHNCRTNLNDTKKEHE